MVFDSFAILYILHENSLYPDYVSFFRSVRIATIPSLGGIIENISIREVNIFSLRKDNSSDLRNMLFYNLSINDIKTLNVVQRTAA